MIATVEIVMAAILFIVGITMVIAGLLIIM